MAKDVDGEQRVLLHGISWDTYVALRDEVDAVGGKLSMTYCVGRLEITSPSTTHAHIQFILGSLIFAWARERRVDLRGFISATYRKKLKRGGLEPDTCFTLGAKPDAEDGGVPDIAIEVVVTSPLLDKLDVYARLGVPEVWTWDAEAPGVVVHALVDDAYVTLDRSRLVPSLDLRLLASFVREGESQIELVDAYCAALRGSPS
jgi:Uma2 family endonuclease